MTMPSILGKVLRLTATSTAPTRRCRCSLKESAMDGWPRSLTHCARGTANRLTQDLSRIEQSFQDRVLAIWGLLGLTPVLRGRADECLLCFQCVPGGYRRKSTVRARWTVRRATPG